MELNKELFSSFGSGLLTPTLKPQVEPPSPYFPSSSELRTNPEPAKLDGSRRRPATARIRHHVTASQSIPSSGAHGGAAQRGKAGGRSAPRGSGGAATPRPAPVSAGGPPRPLSKHALPHRTTTRAARPAPRLRASAPVPMSSPRPRGQQRLSGTLVSVRASRSPQCRGQRRESRDADSQPDGPDSPRGSQTSTSGVPSPGAPESPSVHLREPHDPVRKQRRMGLTAPSRAPSDWLSAPVPWIACQLFPGPRLRDTHLPGLSGLI
ncbi:uncharacterized protein LOC143270205 [Peromyscus maniculatus bairdii]|uniref:uncharacterized protein LOC143270205 n=1 Tax=Peromyscus maniculatus bairdii TaxID=230844 RepID=UPI003FD50ED0